MTYSMPTKSSHIEKGYKEIWKNPVSTPDKSDKMDNFFKDHKFLKWNKNINRKIH